MRKRILIVADGHSAHTHAWLRLLEGTGWDVHAWVGGAVPPVPIDATFHTVDATASNPAGNRLAPFWPLRRGVGTAYRMRFGPYPQGEPRRLAALVRRLRPAIVHSLRLQDESYLVCDALAAIHDVGAAWIVSLWGSDIAHYGRFDEHQRRIRDVLASCRYVTADCRRDLELCRRFGASADKLYFDHPIPGNGGVDAEAIGRYVGEPDPRRRRIVLFPKAREDRFHQFAPVAESLRRAEGALGGMRFVFLRADDVSRCAIDALPPALRLRCDVRADVTPLEALQWMARSRVMVAPSLSDGTPNVMLEAMAAGALPVLSPLESIREWIDDGVNGLLADNGDADALAVALARACTDDVLVRRAAEANRKLVAGYADRRRVRANVLGMYDAIARRRAVHVRASKDRPSPPCKRGVHWADSMDAEDPSLARGAQ